MARIDLALTQDSGTRQYDTAWTTAGDFEVVAGFQTALALSVLGEARADEAEVPLPALRRGWMGSDAWGNELGCRAWLYEQARRTSDTLIGVRNEVDVGVQWLLDNRYVNNITVDAQYGTAGVIITAQLDVRDAPSEVALYELWRNTL